MTPLDGSFGHRAIPIHYLDSPPPRVAELMADVHPLVCSHFVPVIVTSVYCLTAQLLWCSVQPKSKSYICWRRPANDCNRWEADSRDNFAAKPSRQSGSDHSKQVHFTQPVSKHAATVSPGTIARRRVPAGLHATYQSSGRSFCRPTFGQCGWLAHAFAPLRPHIVSHLALSPLFCGRIKVQMFLVRRVCLTCALTI